MLKKSTLELMLFETCFHEAQRAVEYGINCFLVDWEDKGKENRQKGYDTEILPGTLENLQNIAAIPETQVWCRLNRFGSWTKDEVESALQAGAYGLFLPMVTKLDEVTSFLEYIDGRCSSGILIETVEAVSLAKELSLMSLDRIYFGLNDFTISSKETFIFKALYDNTVENVRTQIGTNILFGFGGATAIDCGTPIPAKNLLQEMARLNCSFTFLRRSFKRDSKKYPPSEIIKGIHTYWDEQVSKENKEKNDDYESLLKILAPLC